jgi:hypothetical protein
MDVAPVARKYGREALAPLMAVPMREENLLKVYSEIPCNSAEYDI